MADAEVTTAIDAPAEVVYDMVADLPAMGRWSPECTRCEWLDGANEAVPGARFRGYNRNGLFRWSTTGTVVEAEPAHRVVFDVTSFGMSVSRWGYVIEPAGAERCQVTETWEDQRGALVKTLGALGTGVRDRESHNAEGMRETLRRIKAAAEQR